MEKTINQQFGRRIKFYRELRSLTQEELATKMGYKHKTSIQKIESGDVNIPMHKVKQFSEVLGVPLDTLIKVDYLSTTENLSFVIATEPQKEPTNMEDSDFNCMQNILYMLSRLDREKLQQVETIIKTFVKE